MSDHDPIRPPMSAAEVAEFQRRRRGRNVGVLFALIAVAALLYAIAVVKFKVHG